MQLKIKVNISICLFSLCLFVGILLDNFQKREFYSLEELLFIEEANSPFLDETMIPFQPREYIRIIAEE
ncbi:hypothetical protein CHH55_11690 [Niallia circulans]|uniref:Uncharacterized protein n=1 Tax=Niallia circulans TaxID=1397 RepID=A0A0J1LBH6_NIACI|nr:hypothetical protein [Niallia circulans]KLV26280.1 hypothetical protein ABW02_11360 [Niallia circulans]PAD23805.1 hypothetical protein CHH62_20745 [Niallia circulans]PAD87812.1 hypothetical protein CHH55_11690 [Niallia circulans]PAE12280.1 hypothetical protein CHI02_10650 [Niallia circulans]